MERGTVTLVKNGLKFSTKIVTASDETQYIGCIMDSVLSGKIDSTLWADLLGAGGSLSLLPPT
jgi:hypothetical protein